MALIKCSECGQEISEKATACPHCGCPIKNPVEEANQQQLIHSKRKIAALILVFGILFLAGWFIFNIAISGDMLGEKAFYLSHGYYKQSYYTNKIISKILVYAGVVFSTIGGSLLIIHRNKK